MHILRRRKPFAAFVCLHYAVVTGQRKQSIDSTQEKILFPLMISYLFNSLIIKKLLLEFTIPDSNSKN